MSADDRDLHKALTDLCDDYERKGGRTATVSRLRALLAEHPPTAHDRDALHRVIVEYYDLPPERITDAVIAYLRDTGGEGA